MLTDNAAYRNREENRTNRPYRTICRGIVWTLILTLLFGFALAEAPDGAREALDYSDVQNWVYFGTENGESAADVFFTAPSAFGWRLTEEETAAWPQLRPAQGETDTGVIITFSTEAEDVQDSALIPAGMKTLAINPLNWKTDGEKAEKELNLGACFTDYEGMILDEVPALTGARLDEERGALKVTDIDPEVYNSTLPILAPGVYHLYDYQFFYRNLEKNVQDRIQAYLGESDGK